MTLENTILEYGMESQYYIVGLSNNTNTLTSLQLLIILTSENTVTLALV